MYHVYSYLCPTASITYSLSININTHTALRAHPAVLLASSLVAQTAFGIRNGEGRNKGGALAIQSPRSIGTGDGFAEDMDPFMTLLRSRQHLTPKGDSSAVGGQDASHRTSAATAVAVAAAAAVSVMEDPAATAPYTYAGEGPEQVMARPGERRGGWCRKSRSYRLEIRIDLPISIRVHCICTCIRRYYCCCCCSICVHECMYGDQLTLYPPMEHQCVMHNLHVLMTTRTDSSTYSTVTGVRQMYVGG